MDINALAGYFATEFASPRISKIAKQSESIGCGSVQECHEALS